MKPGSTSRSAWYVRIMSPDATNNTSAIATCATTSVLARAMPLARDAGRSAGAPKHGCDTRRCVFRDRNQAEQQPGRERRREPNAEDGGVDRDPEHDR